MLGFVSLYVMGHMGLSQLINKLSEQVYGCLNL